jgi:hypothetical protein
MDDAKNACLESLDLDATDVNSLVRLADYYAITAEDGMGVSTQVNYAAALVYQFRALRVARKPSDRSLVLDEIADSFSKLGESAKEREYRKKAAQLRHSAASR